MEICAMHINKICSDSRWTSWKEIARDPTNENEDIWHLVERLSSLVNYTISSLIYLMRFSVITNLLQRDFLAENLFEFFQDFFSRHPCIKFYSRFNEEFFFFFLFFETRCPPHFYIPFNSPLSRFSTSFESVPWAVTWFSEVKWTTRKWCNRSRKLFSRNLKLVGDVARRWFKRIPRCWTLMSSICRKHDDSSFKDERLNSGWID